MYEWRWWIRVNYHKATENECCASCRFFVGKCIPHPTRGYDSYDVCTNDDVGYRGSSQDSGHFILAINKPTMAASMVCDRFGACERSEK